MFVFSIFETSPIYQKLTQNARQTGSRGRPAQGSIRHDEDDNQQQNAQNQGGGQGGVSIFHMFNQRLLDAGLPSWNAGPYTVQPIVSIGLLLAFMLFGFRGLFFGGMLFPRD
ncbi:hypothetical protein LSAT2_002776 [Lamellibrachia satsuma]|nr:hypothetical protein LSAT2_002776 [Lamellibrachia satsuma]